MFRSSSDVAEPRSLFLRRLERLAKLYPTERSAVASIIGPTETFHTGTDLIGEGEGTGDLVVLLDGLACKYRTLTSGARQIVSLLLPGDPINLEGYILGAMRLGFAAFPRAPLRPFPGGGSIKRWSSTLVWSMRFGRQQLPTTPSSSNGSSASVAGRRSSGQPTSSARSTRDWSWLGLAKKITSRFP